MSDPFSALPTHHCQKILDGRLYRFDSYSCEFLKTWARTPEALASKEMAVKAAAFLIWEDFRHTDWIHNNPGLGLPQGYRFYGLESLSDLFSENFRSRLKTKPRFLIDKAALFLPLDSDGEYCTLADWEKAFWLSAYEFWLIDATDSATIANFTRLFQKYGLGPVDSFLRDLSDLKDKIRPRKNREFLKRFAMAWDIFVVPLRFFSDEASLDFSTEHLGLEDRDYSNHCKRIHKGGLNRQEGLRLVTEKPHIVTRWGEDR